MSTKHKVFIIWLHKPSSRAFVAVLALLLKEAGLDVAWDKAFKTSNSASLAQQMAAHIENRVVICVVTPELAQWFNPGAQAPAGRHLGIQWEIRLMIQRMYEHGSQDGCPVIPVLPPGVRAEDGPMILRALENTAFNHLTREGLGTIVARVNGAYERAGRGTLERRTGDGTLAPTQPWDHVTEALRTADPSLQHTYELSLTWVKRAHKKGVRYSHDLRMVFKQIRLAALHAGDLVLLEQITDICLEVVEQLDPDHEITTEKCTYLLNRAFLLFCAHEVDLAKAVAERSRALAHGMKHPTLIAMAKRCLAFIHVHLAEFTSGDMRAEKLRQARACAEAALRHFHDVGSEDEHLADLAMAQVHFAEYRHARDKQSLDDAAQLSAKAAKGFRDQGLHWYHEARLLQVEVAFEMGKADTAIELLGETLGDLRSRAEVSEAYEELHGRGQLLRARICVSQRRTDAQTEIGAARAIFDKLGLSRMVAECEWLSFKCDRKRFRFSAYDVRTLERLCPDPVLRVRVAERGRTWSIFWDLLGRIGDKNWKRAIQETLASRNDED